MTEERSQRERKRSQREKGTLEVAPKTKLTKTKLIVNLARDEALCVGVVADRPLARMRGLVGRQALAAGEGMLLRPAPSIHTAFMRFPIDALFLDRELRVIDIVERLPRGGLPLGVMRVRCWSSQPGNARDAACRLATCSASAIANL